MKYFIYKQAYIYTYVFIFTSVGRYAYTSFQWKKLN